MDYRFGSKRYSDSAKLSNCALKRTIKNIVYLLLPGKIIITEVIIIMAMNQKAGI